MSNSNYGINISSTGATVEDANTIYNDLMSMLQAAFALQGKQLNTDKNTVQGHLMSSLTDMLLNKSNDLLYILSNYDINKAEGQWLDCIGKQWGLNRLPATATTAEVTLGGVPGTEIPGLDNYPDAAAEAADSEGRIYQCKETVTIGAGGTVTAVFAAQTAGPIELAAEDLTTVLSSITGWDTIINDNAGITGSAVESDADFRKRIKNLVAQNSSGTLASLVTYIRTLDGVEDCQGRENTTSIAGVYAGYTINPNRYAISVLGGSNSAIAEAIYSRKSAGLQDGNTTVSFAEPVTGQTYSFSIIRPTELEFRIKVTVENQASLPGNITALIKQALYDDFYGVSANSERIKIASITYASRFYSALNDVYPGMEISDITLSTDGGSTWGPSATVNLDQYPSLTTAHITVIFGS